MFFTYLKSYPYFYLLNFFLLVRAVVILTMDLSGMIGLGPDEAQYWTWSQELDWGYYSKPPGIAWQIWLGTQLFGQTELGVRFFSLILSSLHVLILFFLARALPLPQTIAFWCSLAFALSPFELLGSFLAITDVGFLLFWIAACYVVLKALSQNTEPNAIKIGLLVGLGALFKWPIYIFWVFYLIVYRLYFKQQAWIKICLGLCLSICGLLPSIVWNWSHDWATFRHVSSTLQGGHAHTSQSGNTLEWLGSQIALLSPILFILLLLASWQWLKRYKMLNPTIVFCGMVSCITFTILLSASFFQKIQGNWGIFAYPTGFILIGWYVNEQKLTSLNWLKAGIALSVTLVIVTVGATVWLPFKMNPFKHNLGWPELNLALKNYGYDPHKHFLASDKYQTTSELSFYAEEHKRAYFLNIGGARKNQFSYWPSLQEERVGQAGYFVVIEHVPHLYQEAELKVQRYQKELEKYFTQVEFLALHPLIKQREQMVKGAFIFKCSSCLSTEKEENFLY